MGVFTKVHSRRNVVSPRGLDFCAYRKIPKPLLFFVDTNSDSKNSFALVATNAFIASGIVLAAFLIVFLLEACRGAKVFIDVVQRIVIAMISFSVVAIKKTKNLAMHGNSGSLSTCETDVSIGVHVPIGAHISYPVELGKVVKAMNADSRNLAPREGDDAVGLIERLNNRFPFQRGSGHDCTSNAIAAFGRISIVIAFLLLPFAAAAQNDALQGHCTLGGTKAIVSGLNSTNSQQGIVPGCTVTVYMTGTTNLATIYSNSTGTPLSNPFTAVASGSPNPGYWIFWAATGQGYDVKLSGGGGNPACTSAPNCYTTPLTYTDLKVGGSGGGAGLTNFTAGNLAPLFNTAVANPTTTPNLTFTQQSAPANTLFGNFSSTSGPPFFATFTCTGLLTCTYNSGSNVWDVSVPSTSSLSITATSPIRVNGGTGPVSSGTANIDCPTCGTPQIQMNVVPPASGNYTVWYPANQDFTTGSSGYCAGWNAANSSGGYGVSFPSYSGLFTGGICKNTLSGWVDVNGTPWPGAINPANVTSVWAVSINDFQNGAYVPPYSGQTFGGSATASCAGSTILNTSRVAAQKNALTTLTGATVGSSTCVESITQSSSITTAMSAAYLNAPLIALYVYSTDAPTPSSTALNVGPYLSYDQNERLLTTAPQFPNFLFANTVTQLNSLPPGSNFAVVWDYTSTSYGNCGTTPGSVTALAAWDIATGVWKCTPLGSVGAGSVTSVTADTTSGLSASPNPIVSTGTVSCQQASATQFGCMKPDNSTITCAAGVCTAVGGGSVGGSGTAGFIALWSASTTLGNSPLDYNVTLANFVTSSKPLQVVCSTCATQIDLTYNSGHPAVGTAGKATFAVDSSGNAIASDGAATTTLSQVCTVGNALCGGGGSGSPGTPAGTVQAYKTSTTFGGTTTWIAAAGYNGMACDGTTDDTTAFNALLSTVYTAGGGTIHVSGTCLLSGQINLPNDGATTNPSQPTIRITGDGGGGSGAWQTPFLAPPATSGTLDLRVTATYGKILTLGVGKLEIDHLVLKDGGTDCTAFVYTTNTTLELHDNLFTGTASGTSACNDAVILGGTTTVYGGNTATAAFQGYNTYINHNFFDKIRRGVYFREAANAVVVRDNTFSKTCGATSSEAAIEVGYAGFGQVQSNVFSGNLFEVTNYPYVYKVWDDNNQWFGDTFWDGTGTLLDLFNFGAAAGNNTAFISHDASITQAKLSNSSLINGTSNNSVLDQNAQLELGAAAALGRTCADTSGSGTAQSCSTYVTYTPQTSAWIIYTTTTANTGTGLTINVNSGGAKSVYKCAGSTATLAVGDIPANKPIPMYLDAAGHWNAVSTTTGCSSSAVAFNNVMSGTNNGGNALHVSSTSSLTVDGGTFFKGTVNAQTGTTYTFVAADNGELTTFSNASAISVTLPQATTSGFTAGASFDVQNIGAGTATITPTTSTINGGASLALGQGQGAHIVSDGTNYAAQYWPSATSSGVSSITATSPLTANGSSGSAQTGAVTVACPTCGSGGSGAWTNITGSTQITATGCTQSASTGGNCAISGSSTTAVTFSVIPGTFSNLELVFWGRSSAGGNGKITINGDTGNNYVLNGYFQSGTSVSQNAIYSTNGCGVVATVASGIVGYSIVTIPFYADTSFGKYLSVRDGGGTGVTSGNPVDSTGSCGWNSTAAITSITVTLASGNFTAGSKFQIYAQN